MDQITQLRRRVINRIKPKTLNGKKLTGEMLYGLVESYVTSINQGIVPNIENAWSYICKSECHTAMTDALERFETDMKDTFYARVPMFEEELKDLYNEAKKGAIAFFNSKSVGEIANDYLEDLKVKIKQKYSTIRAENEKESRKNCSTFLQNSYQPVENKLRNQDFESFGEFEREIKGFQQFFMENGPAGPQRRTLMLEFT